MKRTHDDQQITSANRRRALSLGCGPAFLPSHGAYLARWLLVALGFGVRLPAADAARVARGQELYVRNCFACHQLDGAGVPGTFPPLAKSDYLLADVERAIRVVCEGLTGDVVVNGQKYSGVMPP